MVDVDIVAVKLAEIADPAKVYLAATAGLVELERFAEKVGTWVRERFSGEEDSAEPAEPAAEDGTG